MSKADATFLYLGVYADEAAAQADYEVVKALHMVDAAPLGPQTASGINRSRRDDEQGADMRQVRAAGRAPRSRR